jgi:two-component sensor histidine kinase
MTVFNEITSDRTVPTLSEDMLLLAESNHRTANELTAAIAAMRIARMSKGMNVRKRMIDDAIERLEGFGEVHRLFASRPLAVVEVSAEMDRLVRALASARLEADGSLITLDLPLTFVDGPTARRLTLIAAELVTNVMRHALAGRRGHLKVTLSAANGEVELLVEDDGPGIRRGASTTGTGLGTGIVAELIGRGRGRIEASTGPWGTRTTVILPYDVAAVAAETRRA